MEPQWAVYRRPLRHFDIIPRHQSKSHFSLSLSFWGNKTVVSNLLWTVYRVINPSFNLTTPVFIRYPLKEAVIDFVVFLLLQLMVATILATYIAKHWVNKHTCLFGLYSSCECFGFLSSSSTMAFDLALIAMWSAESPLLSVALSFALLSSSNSTASTQRPRTALKNAIFGHWLILIV